MLEITVLKQIIIYKPTATSILLLNTETEIVAY